MSSENPASLSVVLDFLGILMVVGDGLDNEYLDTWAKTLELSDLLERARREV